MKLARSTKVATRTIWASAIVASLFVCLVFSSPANAFRLAEQSGWIQISPAGEEFTISVPAAPRVTEGSRYFFIDRQLLVPFRIYRVFAGGTLFTVESYGAAHPKDLAKVLLSGRRSIHFESDVAIGDLKGKTFTQEIEGLNFKGEYLVGRKHLYIVEAARRGNYDPAIDQFFGSLSFHEDEPNASDAAFAIAGEDQSEVLPVRQVTSRAIILSKLPANFTDEARSHRVNGTVVVEAVFRANGEVTDIAIRSGLPYGLSEQSIEATKAIIFVPGEKDGVPISQHLIVEYNFHIY